MVGLQMSEEITELIHTIATQARDASRGISAATTAQKNQALEAIARELESNRKTLTEENQKDLQAAEQNGLTEAMIDRLRLTHDRIDGMAQGLRQLIDLPDPVGGLIEEKKRPNGLQIRKVRTPIGVIGIIYESRPNVTIDCAGLCLKSGNAAILRGGKEALHSNQALANILANALESTDLPKHSVQLIPTTDRSALNHLLTLDEYVHCIIPRGGEGLIRFVAENSRIPVIKHYKGVCNLYLDEGCDPAMAQNIAVSAKCGRPGVCNAIENLIIHASHLDTLLPNIAQSLHEKGCQIFADQRATQAIGATPSQPAGMQNLRRNFSIFGSLSKPWTPSKMRSPLSTNMAVGTANPSSPPRPTGPKNFKGKSMRPRCTGMPAPVLPMGLNLGWGQRLVSPRTACMHAGRWGWRNCALTNT